MANVRTIIFLFLMGLFSQASCKKDNPQPPDVDVVKLTAKSWKFESGTISPNYKGSAVLSTDVLPECSRDNVVTYKLDYTVESQEGNLKCRENSVINGTWGVNTDKKSMYVKLSSEYMNKLEYVEVSDSTLKYRYSWTNIDGTFTIFYKFKAI